MSKTKQELEVEIRKVQELRREFIQNNPDFKKSDAILKIKELEGESKKLGDDLKDQNSALKTTEESIKETQEEIKKVRSTGKSTDPDLSPEDEIRSLEDDIRLLESKKETESQEAKKIQFEINKKIEEIEKLTKAIVDFEACREEREAELNSQLEALGKHSESRQPEIPHPQEQRQTTQVNILPEDRGKVNFMPNQNESNELFIKHTLEVVTTTDDMIVTNVKKK